MLHYNWHNKIKCYFTLYLILVWWFTSCQYKILSREKLINSRLIIAAGDISSSPIFAKRFIGKIAKEIYRCGKGIVLTQSISKLLGFAVATVPQEISKGFIYTAMGQVGEAALGYISGIGFVRYIYIR